LDDLLARPRANTKVGDLMDTTMVFAVNTGPGDGKAKEGVIDARDRAPPPRQKTGAAPVDP